jgi:hypothetical protein
VGHADKIRQAFLEGVVESPGGEPGVERRVDHRVFFGVADHLAGGGHGVDSGAPGLRGGGAAGRADDDFQFLAGEFRQVELEAAGGVGCEGLADQAHEVLPKAAISSRV